MLNATDNSILLYVHGFNTGMNKATRRAGQLTYDLGWDGPSFVFSWPSQGSFADYGTDGTLAARSYNEMAQILSDLSDLNPDRLVVIAHSMGTRVFAHGLARLARENEDAARKITSVILAAADIDEEVFVDDLVPEFRALTETQFTLYGSNKDSALSISEVANGFPRIGDTTNRIPVIDGFDVIDASTTTSNFFEHTYFAESTSILTDVYRMVQNGQSVEERMGETLVKITKGDTDHWQINPEPLVLPACKARDKNDSAFRFHQEPCDPTLPLE
jgi:esterase/lipase superfamily enzyme